MEATLSFIQELSEKVTELIGFHLRADHIHYIGEDGAGWHYYIQALQPGYPVLAMHYRGPLMLALPFADYCKLEAGEITVDAYIAQSHWNYGYYWGGGGLLSGAYWQPLEAETGIHDTERISRYLQILSCRTFRRSSGHIPSIENCAKCQLDETGCPFSPQNQTGSWDNEVAEPDGRVELFQAVCERVQQELGFERYDFMSHNESKHELLLFPGMKPNTVRIFLSRDLLNDLLYHPEVKRDWKEMAARLDIALAMPFHPEQRTMLDLNAPDLRAACLDFWGDNMLQKVGSAEAAAMQTARVDHGFITPRGIKILTTLNKAFNKVIDKARG